MKTETPETEKGIDPKMKTPKEVIITETEIFPETEADIKTETKQATVSKSSEPTANLTEMSTGPTHATFLGKAFLEIYQKEIWSSQHRLPFKAYTTVYKDV